MHGGAWACAPLKEHAERYTECVTRSVGKVQEFLTRTPCRRLDRMPFALGNGDGNIAVVAVSWVEFRGRTAARAFRDISDTYGSGYVRPMAGAVLGVTDVRLTGQHYASRLTGAMTVSAEAEPITGQFDDQVLDAIAEVATWAPRR